MDWNQYAKDIKQADANVQAVVRNGHIKLDSLQLTNTLHSGIERTGRNAAVNQEGGGFGNEILAVYYVDRNHPNGPELHWITDNAIILITNALRGNGLNVCTQLPARPGQLKRYPTGDNPSFTACEQMFPENDWKIPTWLLNKAQEHQRMGLNYRESFNESYQLGDLLEDRQEMAWDYVTYYGNRKLRELIESDPEAEMKIKEAVYDAVEREVPDVTDDDDDFTKTSSVGMEAAMQEFERIQSRKMAAESFMDSLKEANEMSNESAEPDYLDYDENTMYMLETEDEDGEVKEFSVDLADESDWGNINTADGTCYFPSGDVFDGIGWGNDEDGYQKITRVVDMRRGKDVRLEEFADIVDEFVSLYSDM